jgi:SAM-dependent methyltransferase
VTNTNFLKSYPDHVAGLLKRLGNETALRQAIGGDFVAVGKLEFWLLMSLGLADGAFLVDIGCGSGRLACQLAKFEHLRYLGTDVVPELLEYARLLTNRADWQFLLTNGVCIPCEDNKADYVASFSVFTHLLHEETYRYFLEANRILKPGGYLVFSFLEFRIACHWETFISSVNSTQQGKHLNQFMDRDAIRVWAQRSGFAEPRIFDGDRGHIPIPEEIQWDNGMKMGTFGNLGQSVAILRKL